MIKVIVVDDEIKVCQLICALVDWDALDMEIVGVAHNGEQALELIRQSKPDIAITDIRMPGLDGLELIRRARDEWNELQFIIISGHRHFEYAQSAIKYGVSDYLLKPINQAELQAALMRMRDEYRRRRQQISMQEQMEIRLQGDMDKLRRGLLTDLLQDGEQAELSIEAVNAGYHYNFRQGNYVAMILKLDYSQDTGDISILKEKALYGLQAMLKPYSYDMQVYLLGNRIYGVLNYAAQDSATIRKTLKNALDDLAVQADAFGGINLTIGLGGEQQDIALLRRSMADAQQALAQRLLMGCGRIIEGNSAASPSTDVNPLMVELHKGVNAALDVMDSSMLAGSLDAFKNRALAAQPSGIELLALVQDAFRTSIILLRNHIHVSDIDRHCSRFGDEADMCTSAEQLFALLATSLAGLLDEAASKSEQESSRPVRIARQYINENYMKPISLEIVSERVGFNPSYFSTLFKKESGQNFGEYLADVRMNKAKELLKETTDTVASICEQVGYSDAKHFTQSFKKHTGLKPNEYRKLFS